MYNKLYFPMKDIYSNNMYFSTASISRANPSYDFEKVLPQTYNHFIKVNGIIYFVLDANELVYRLSNHIPMTSIAYALPKTDLTVLSETTFDRFISFFNSSKISKKLKNKYVSNLKRLSPMRVIADLPQTGCILDESGRCLKFKDDKFVLEELKDGKNIQPTMQTPKKDLVDAYICNFINSSFKHGEYQITDRIKELLRKLSGNNPRSLKAIAKLTAAAYSTNLPLREAIIVVAKGAAYKAAESFFNKLFDENIYVLNSETLKSARTFFSAYTDTLFMGGGTYVIEEGQTLNSKVLSKLIKSTYFEVDDKLAGKIKFRNKIPLIVLTKHEEFAELFKSCAKAYIVNTDSGFSMVDNISSDELAQIRQALTLYGLKLLLSPQKNSDLPVCNAQSNEEVVKEFVRLYCKKNKNGIIGKSDLRNAFKEYANLYYPYFNISPLAVCNHLQNLGCDTAHKKRIDGKKNPVGVIIGAEFNSDKFETDISLAKNSISGEKPEIDEDAYEEVWLELLSSRIE